MFSTTASVAIAVRSTAARSVVTKPGVARSSALVPGISVPRRGAAIIAIATELSALDDA